MSFYCLDKHILLLIIDRSNLDNQITFVISFLVAFHKKGSFSFLHTSFLVILSDYEVYFITHPNTAFNDSLYTYITPICLIVSV